MVALGRSNESYKGQKKKLKILIGYETLKNMDQKQVHQNQIKITEITWLEKENEVETISWTRQMT